MKEQQQTDQAIKALLKADDMSALDMLWDVYASDLLGYLVSMLCSRHDAEDVLQEVFVMIARKRGAVARARKLKPYLYRLSRNLALNSIKRNRRRSEREENAGEWLEFESEGMDGEERCRSLENVLTALPETQRTVIVLKFFRDKTFREISEILGISENTAGSRYRYGMAKLKELLREVPDET